MSGIWTRLFGSCEHETNLVVTSVGVTRAVCERCGHISFEIDKTSEFEWSIAESDETTGLPKAVGL